MAALIAAAGLAVASCSPARTVGRRPPAPSTTERRSVTSAKATTPVAVGTTTLTVTRAGRAFGVQVLYPALRGGSAGTPLTARSPFPLIVFSPGFDVSPAAYNAMVVRWASLAFVVAIPHYPFTAPDAPGGVDEADIVQHPADLEATIGELLETSGRPGNLLTGMINPSRIAVAGHSDGGDVTDAVVSDSCCLDSRIRAAAILSGAQLTSFGGSYGPAPVPLLVVQGDSDTVNAPACSEQIYDTGGAPRFYLDLRGAEHLPPYTTDPGAVERVTALFWTAYLKGDSVAATALKAGTAARPEATLIDGGPVPRIGGCPGAP